MCNEAGGYSGGIGDGFCDVINKIEECQFDGGDCSHIGMTLIAGGQNWWGIHKGTYNW